MNFVDIVRVMEVDLKMSRMVYCLHHGGNEIAEAYRKGWAQAIRDAHKGLGEGKR